MRENFLSYLLEENISETANDLLTYVHWTDDEMEKYKYPSSLKINKDDLKIFDHSKSANEIILKLYNDDNDLLFLILYTQRLIYMSNLEEIITYNSDLENPNFEYDPDIHEHMYMTNVDVFMIRTKNKIYIFELNAAQECEFEEVVLSSNGNNITNPIAIKTFDRLGIKHNRNFQELINIIETHFKKNA
jgi:hypothetical protein